MKIILTGATGFVGEGVPVDKIAWWQDFQEN